MSRFTRPLDAATGNAMTSGVGGLSRLAGPLTAGVVVVVVVVVDVTVVKVAVVVLVVSDTTTNVVGLVVVDVVVDTGEAVTVVYTVLVVVLRSVSRKLRLFDCCERVGLTQDTERQSSLQKKSSRP